MLWYKTVIVDMKFNIWVLRVSSEVSCDNLESVFFVAKIDW